IDRNLLLDFFQEYGFDSINVIEGRLYPNDGSSKRILSHFISLIDNEEYSELSFTPKKDWPRLNYWEHILLNLPESAGFDPYYSGYLERKEEEKSFAAFIFSLDRSSASLSRMWTLTRGAAFNVVSQEKYYDSKYYRYVDGLLDTYNYILEKDEPNLVFDMLNRRLESQEYYSTWDSKYLYKDFIPLTLLREFSGSDFEPILEDSEHFRDEHITAQSAWFVSFWQRRYSEGNLQVAHRILSDIQAHYEGELMAEKAVETCDEFKTIHDSISFSSKPDGKGNTFIFEADLYTGGVFASVANKLVMDNAANIPMGEWIIPSPTQGFSTD
ncbi:MAG: hypothetical protein JKY54_11750, partial [Flavobacteriales bacterium]|nr:hypothetical protein [Flavobacteriales bacterium]